MCSTTAVGIDLGTTFSCVAVFRRGRPQVIKCQGKRTIPSAVFFHKQKPSVSVGTDAQDEAPRCFKNEIFDVKRIIGRLFDDCYVQGLIKSEQYPFCITRGYEGEVSIQTEYKGRQLSKTPEVVSSHLLTTLKDAATEFLGEDVTEAVISVPAYFSNSQRKATKKAAELAGLTVLRFIYEPVAAAVQYTFDSTNCETLLVFDFGGGTLDVSIIRVAGKTYEVKAVNGDTALGGRDVDQILVNRFKSLLDSSSDCLLNRRLLINCIKLKKKLSVPRNVSEEVEQTFFYNNKNYTLAMSRETFDNLNKHIFKRAIDVVETCLFKAALGTGSIDEVVLVGGSCKILKVQEMLQEYFSGKQLRKDVDPDEAIALGACIQAAVLKRGEGELENYRIIEVTPLSLGVDSFGDAMSVFIPRNSPLPATEKKNFMTIRNDQTSVTFGIYEGERSQIRYNTKLGEVTIAGLPKGKVGEVKFETMFKLDENGILEISACEKITNKTGSLVVSMGNFHLCEYQVNKSLKEALDNAEEDTIFSNFITERNIKITRCHSVIYDAEKVSDGKDKCFLQKECKTFIVLAVTIDFHQIDTLRTEFRNLCRKVADTIKKYPHVILRVEYEDFVSCAY